MLEEREIYFCMKTTEIFAYTEQWFFNKIHDFFVALKQIENGKESKETN